MYHARITAEDAYYRFLNACEDFLLKAIKFTKLVIKIKKKIQSCLPALH